MPQAVEPAAQRPVSETGLRDGAQRELELVDKRRSRTPDHNVSAQASAATPTAAAASTSCLRLRLLLRMVMTVVPRMVMTVV